MIGMSPAGKNRALAELADAPAGDHAIAERRFLMDDAIELVADIGGPETAPTVVLAHGGGQTRHSWASAMQALVDRDYRVINYDARGHGDSGWSADGDYSFDRRRRDLMVLVAGIDAPIALVGASMGGVTALEAVAHGYRPASLILVDIVPQPAEVGVTRIVDFMTRHLSGFESLDAAADAVAAYTPERPRPRNAEGLRKNLRQRSGGRYFWHWDPKILETDVTGDRMRLNNRLDRLAGHLSVPTLLVRGMHSDVVDESGVDHLRSIVPALEVCDVQGAGHMVANDRNDAFNQAILDFLRQHMAVA